MKRNRPTRDIPSYAYQMGQLAYANGRVAVRCECPYPIGSGDQRTQWYMGYLDAKNARLLNLNPPPLRQGDTK